MIAAPTATQIASLDQIRAQFPALERRHHGVPVAYFDGPGGTQVPRAVVDAMADYLLHHNANTHWEFPSSVETDAALAAARAALADLLGGRPSEIAFGANMTTLTFHVGRALGARWSAGDELVVTELDHHANVDPWRRLARERGLTVRTVPLRPETGQLDPEALAAAIGPRTRLLAIGAASNALGTINDVRRAADLAHAAGALVFVDAVHYAPHELVDVAALGADLLACSAYKFYGPHVGVLWGRQSLLEALDAPRLEPAPAAAPDRLETGTQNHEGIVGAGAAVDFLASLAGPASAPAPAAAAAGSDSAAAAAAAFAFSSSSSSASSAAASATGAAAAGAAAAAAGAAAAGAAAAGAAAAGAVGAPTGPSRRARLAAAFAALHARGHELISQLWTGLSEIPGVTVYGPPPTAPRTPTLSFAVHGWTSDAVSRALAERAVFVSSGDFYATTVVARLGHTADGLVRAGCACYTTPAEVARLLDGVRALTR